MNERIFIIYFDDQRVGTVFVYNTSHVVLTEDEYLKRYLCSAQFDRHHPSVPTGYTLKEATE